uniref:Talin-1 n=1 Tax=Schistocephalus solidus TaxID=70667 RepID=A0A0X3PHC1_SCHSO
MPWTFPAGPPMTGDSRRLALRIHVPDADVTKTLVFDALMTVGQACDQIRQQIREIDGLDNPKDYGLFLPHEDSKKGLWLDHSRSLEHYILRNGDTVEYKYRYRWLYIRTMDGTRKTLRVDDSKTLSELMLPICTKMGIYNYEEYLLVRDVDEAEKDRTMTLRKSHQTGMSGTLRDAEKMDKLRRELHTDDDVTWLNPSQSLRQQGIGEKEILLLRRRYFFSDMNVDARDPVQLNLLYVQLKDAILNGTHPVTLDEAVYLAAIQCQVELGNYNPEKFKSGFLDLKDFLPKEFLKVKGLEKKIFQQHATLNGISDVEARVKYCHFCRSLKTYGITFFLVKEKMKGKNRLIPRLLGITRDSVVRLDERTKEVVKVWPLTSILKWAASPNAFTMDFGEYSPDEYYTAQTSEGEQISQLIAGYIDIILKKQKARDHQGLQGDEESAMYEENVRAERAKIVQSARRSVGPADRDRNAATDGVSETIDSQRVETQMNGYTGDQLNGYMGTTERHLITLESPVSIDGQSVVSRQRNDNQDDFMTGGTHTYHYQTMTPVQRALMLTIDENMEVLEQGKQMLDIGSPSERVLLNIGHDEASKRWLDESMGASQVKVADDVGAMNAAVAQAVRSANRADAVLSQTAGYEVGAGSDPGDDLMMMQQSFRVVTVHFPAFVDDVKRVAVLRRETGALQAEAEENPETREYITMRAENSAQNLLGAARTVADSFSELLKAATPLATQQQTDYEISSTVQYSDHAVPVGGSSRKAILEAANRVGEASNDFLRFVIQDGEEQAMATDDTGTGLRSFAEEERAYQDELLGLAKEVANATAGLVVKAKHLATQTNLDPEHQQDVVFAATQTGLCTSQLVACTKVLAPTIRQPTCQQQLSESAREVSVAVDGVVKAARGAGQSVYDQQQNLSPEESAEVNEAVRDVDDAATEVRNTLDRLNAHLLKESVRPYRGDNLDLFQAAYEALQRETDGQRMVAAARRLSQVSAQMIADVKTQAEQADGDPERQTKLFAAAKQLADATTDLINHAKVCSTAPDSEPNQTKLKQSADELVVVAYASAAELLNARVMRSLQAAARAVVTASTHLVNTSRCAAKKSRANNYHILEDARVVNELTPKLVAAIRYVRSHPDDPLAQLELICACQQVVEPCSILARSSRSMAPTVSDPSLQSTLELSMSQMVVAVETLRACLGRAAPIARQLQMDGALARLLRLIRESEETESSARAGSLTALPDDKVEDRFQMLSLGVRDGIDAGNQIGAAVESLTSAYSVYPSASGRDQEEDWLGSSSNQLASALADLVQATRCIAAADMATTKGVAGEVLTEFLHSCVLSTQIAYQLVCESRKLEVLEPSQTPETQAALLQRNTEVNTKCRDYITDLTAALTGCLRGLPGQREISEASIMVKRRRHDLVRFAEDPTIIEFHDADQISPADTRTDFTGAAVEFNQATVELTSCYTPNNFKRSSLRFAGAYDNLVDRGLRLSRSKPPEDITGKEIVNELVQISDKSEILLEDAQQVCNEPEIQPLRNRLHSAAKSVTDSINHLLNLSTSGLAPGATDCDAALRRLEALRPLLEQPTRPINQHIYHECIETVAQSTVPLADGLRGISNAVNENNADKFSVHVQQTTDSICLLIEETAQAAYLIGIAHPKSKPGTKSPVDRALFEGIQREIQDACKAITSPQVTERQVVSLANDISSNLRTLCDACTSISAQATSAEERRQLKTLTQDMMQSITELVKRSADWSEEGKRATANNAHLVNTHVSQLVRFVTCGPQFAGHPARITAEARESQQPLCTAGISCLDAGKSVLIASKHMVNSAQTKNESADSSFMNFSAASHDLSDGIKHLVSVLKSHAPGQAECQQALENIARLLRDLQRDEMAIMDDRFPQRHDNTAEGFQKQLTTSVRAVMEMAPTLGRAATSEAERLGHSVRELDALLPGIVSSALGSASRAPPGCPSQLIYLGHTRTLLESSEQLVLAAKEAGGNPRSVHLHAPIEDAVRAQIESCEDLLSAVDSIVSQHDFMEKLMAVLNQSQSVVDQPARVPRDAHFTDYQARMLRLARHMEQQTQSAVIVSRRADATAELPPVANNLAQDYAELCLVCRDASETLPDGRQSDQLRSAVKNVGNATRALIQSATSGAFARTRDGPGRQLVEESSSQRNLDYAAGLMNDRLRELIALLEAQGPGTQACLQGASTVSGIIADLDTTILFASSGTLHPPIHDDFDVANLDRRRAGERFSLTIRGADDFGHEAQDNFISIRESINRAADALVEDTRSLVSGAGEDQNRLAGSTHLAVRNISQLAEVVKQGASILGPGQLDNQVALLEGAKETAVSVRTLFLTASQLHGRQKPDPVYEDLRLSGDAVQNSAAKLVTLANSIDSESTRGTKALIAATKFCHQMADHVSTMGAELSASQVEMNSAVNQCGSASTLLSTTSLVSRYMAPEELSRAVAGPMQLVVSKAVLASSSRKQDDGLTAANTARHALIDLVQACKGLVRQQEVSKEARQSTKSAVKQIASEFAKLLDGVKCVIHADNEKDRERISLAAGRIAALSSQLLNIAEGLKEGPRLVMYFRASSPEWRDVAEKFLGRHVAFHHHYVPCYGKDGSSVTSTRVASHQTSCLQMRLDSVGRVVVGEGASSEAEKRIDAALQRLEDGLNRARTHEQATTPSVQPILSMTKSIALAAREFIQAVRTSSGAGETPKTSRSGSETATLGRSELSVSVATEYLCELARFCSASRPEGPTAAPVDDPVKIMPSRERLLAAIRQVASTSAELLYAARSRRQLPPTRLSAVQATGKAVKEQTDKMAMMVLNGGPLFDHLPTGGIVEDSTPLHYANLGDSLRPGFFEKIETQAKIQTEQAALEDLQHQLEELTRQQAAIQPEYPTDQL